jgi:hypothetical protein
MAKTFSFLHPNASLQDSTSDEWRTNSAYARGRLSVLREESEMEDDKYTRPDPVELTADELKAVSGGSLVNVEGNTIQANVNVLGIAAQSNRD